MLDHLFDRVDLTAAHTVLGILGILTCVYVMQLTRYEAEDLMDPAWLRFLRRAALGLMAWALCWCLTFSENKNWQPWPPYVMALFAMDMILVIRALAIRARIRRTGHLVAGDYRAVASTRAKQMVRN
jgi:hypothetical protein